MALVLLTAFVLDLRKDAGGGHTDASPALGTHGVPVQEDGRPHAEDLAGGGDCGDRIRLAPNLLRIRLSQASIWVGPGVSLSAFDLEGVSMMC